MTPLGADPAKHQEQHNKVTHGATPLIAGRVPIHVSSSAVQGHLQTVDDATSQHNPTSWAAECLVNTRIERSPPCEPFSAPDSLSAASAPVTLASGIFASVVPRAT